MVAVYRLRRGSSSSRSLAAMRFSASVSGESGNFDSRTASSTVRRSA
jgi:hypothetical protein